MRTPPSISHVVLFRSESNPNKTYETLKYTDGTTSCACRGWTLRTTADGQRACRHTRLLMTQHYRADPTFLTETHYYGDGAAVAAADVPNTKRKSKPAPPPTMMGGRKFNL